MDKKWLYVFEIAFRQKKIFERIQKICQKVSVNMLVLFSSIIIVLELIT